MTMKTKPMPAAVQMFLLDKAKKRPERFLLLHPQVVSSARGLRDSVARATKDTLWISYEKDLTEALLKTVLGPRRSLGKALLIHALNPLSVPVLTSCFKRFASASNKEFLPPEELAEALQAENSPNLFVGGSVDPANQTITLWRGNLEPLTVPW